MDAEGSTLTGGCACGAVRYVSGSAPLFSLHCQCRACQRASGTGHGTSIVLPAATFSISGELQFYEFKSDSGNLVSRGFCPACALIVETATAASRFGTSSP